MYSGQECSVLHLQHNRLITQEDENVIQHEHVKEVPIFKPNAKAIRIN
jgi:hypothetical protein